MKSFLSPWKYSQIISDDISEREDRSSICYNQIRCPIFGPTILWVFSTLTFFALFLFMLLKDLLYTETCQLWHSSDFAKARSIISLQSVQFMGSIRVNENGTGSRIQDLSYPQYAGPANPEIDYAWEELIGKRYFYISEDEAQNAWGESYKEYHHEWRDNSNVYVAGLDVMHTLHCVDILRRTLDPEYYANSTHPHFGRVHYDHCIDHLRQYIMCSGDLTPIPTRWNQFIEFDYVDTNQIHTCRNYHKVRAWVDSRETAV